METGTVATLACGLCECLEHEVDHLVQLGKMGHVCLSCLEQVAMTTLPLSVTACAPNCAHPPHKPAQALPDNVVLLNPVAGSGLAAG